MKDSKSVALPRFITTILWLLPFFSFSQVIYNGHIFDVGNGKGVGQAKIEITDLQIETHSNAYGDFIMKSNFEEPPVTDPYRFFDNSLILGEETAINMKMYNLNGKLIFEDDFGSGGAYLFPQLKYGLYFMKLTSKNYIHTYKVLSDGQQTVSVDKRTSWYRPGTSEGSDTLLITREGYFPRTVAVSRKNPFPEIGLLKGTYENLKYFNELIDPVAFDLLSSSPSRSNVSEVKAVKLIYDNRKDVLFYMNTKAYNLHYTFARDVLGFDQGPFVFNLTQYTDNPNRYMLLASLNYYEAQEKFVLQFVTASEMTCQSIKKFYEKILETSFIGENLYFYPIKPNWTGCAGIKEISSEQLYNGQNYQALNLSEGYGYLRKINIQDLDNLYIGRHDIVLIEGVPNDLPVVAGIITTEFQTPLSHINILSHTRNTPNMALRDGWDNAILNPLVGELVYLKVGAEGYEIRLATTEEATDFWDQSEPRETIFLSRDIDFAGIVDLNQADVSYVDRIGGKAANFSEIMKVNYRGKRVPVPESPFAIPFHYYHHHLEANGLVEFIDKMLTDELFITDPDYRKERLEILRDSIKNSPIDPVLVDSVKTKIKDFRDFRSFRFRSSTNAEDLEFFSGAGLYDSYSAKKDHDTKTIESAVKKVWASLWNWRAFEERSYFKIDHRSTAMGILVHRSFPDEDANGVLVTKNLYNSNPGFVINVQYKEYSIVYPEPGIIHDQIILFTWSVDPGSDFMIEYLTFSNVPELDGRTVVTDEELTELGVYSIGIKERFYNLYGHNCNCSYDNFGVDIEFKIDSQKSPRQIYIKQARLFK